MQLTEEEAQFVAKRSRLVHAWRPVGVLLLAGLSILAGWLFWFVPLLANPFAVFERLQQQDAIPASTMVVATALLPIAFCLSVLLAVAVVLFVFAAIANERKYLAIVRRLAGDA